MQRYNQLHKAKSKNRKLPVIILLVALIIGATVGYFWVNKSKVVAPGQNNNAEQSQQGFNKQQYSLTDPASLWVIVNKNHPLPSNYVPSDLVAVNVPKHGDKAAEELVMRKEAGQALEHLVAGAKADGINLAEGSGYRSYALQKFYYDNYSAQSGQAEANKFSAQPGKSEHQTGLATDLAAVSGKCYLEVCFAETPEGQWIAANAHKYGFSLRYLEGKEEITGYQFEPWHLRYVGKGLAAELQKTGQTLEEFFGVN